MGERGAQEKKMKKIRYHEYFLEICLVPRPDRGSSLHPRFRPRRWCRCHGRRGDRVGAHSHWSEVFQVPEDQWEEAGGEQMYSVKITIPEDSLTQEFYYFCHIHSGMSGLMVVEDPAPDANQLVTPLSADYYGAPPMEFDVECGTYDNVTVFNTEKDSFCPGQTFLCDPTGSPFSQCMEAIDCKMNYEMRVKENEANKLAVFMEQMIPHHWNAILMSRIALKHATDAEGWDDEELNVPQLMRNIINVQMQQIQQMEAWLETYSEPTVVCAAT